MPLPPAYSHLASKKEVGPPIKKLPITRRRTRRGPAPAYLHMGQANPRRWVGTHPWPSVSQPGCWEAALLPPAVGARICGCLGTALVSQSARLFSDECLLMQSALRAAGCALPVMLQRCFPFHEEREGAGRELY